MPNRRFYSFGRRFAISFISFLASLNGYSIVHRRASLCRRQFRPVSPERSAWHYIFAFSRTGADGQDKVLYLTNER